MFVDLADHRRDRLVARTLRDLHEIGQRDRHADGGDQRRQPERAAKRPVRHFFDRPVVEAGKQHRHDHHDQQEQHHVNAHEDAPQDEEYDEGGEGPEHEDITVGEVDHADDAVDHRVADRDQAVDGSQRQPVDKLLDEIFHMFAAPLGMSPRRTHPFFIVPLVVRIRAGNAMRFLLPRHRNLSAFDSAVSCAGLLDQRGPYHWHKAMSLMNQQPSTLPSAKTRASCPFFRDSLRRADFRRRMPGPLPWVSSRRIREQTGRGRRW